MNEIYVALSGDRHATIGPAGVNIIQDYWHFKPSAVTLSREEALTLACSLPEIQALIKWAHNVVETMSEADLFPHGVEELKPFIGKEIE